MSITGEIRPRFESRHGYKQLAQKDIGGANFISQRSRLNLNFKSESFIVGLSVQDVRVWGDVPQLNAFDNNAPAIHEAWGEMIFFRCFFSQSRSTGNSL